MKNQFSIEQELIKLAQSNLPENQNKQNYLLGLNHLDQAALLSDELGYNKLSEELSNLIEKLSINRIS